MIPAPPESIIADIVNSGPYSPSSVYGVVVALVAERGGLRDAVDRVSALCDEWDAQPNDTPHHVDGKLRSSRVRAAIAGQG